MKVYTKNPRTSYTVKKAAKVLSNPLANTETKSNAGKILAKHAEKIRTIKSAKSRP